MKDYSKYELSDFLRDDDFILEQMMPTEDSTAYWDNFRKNNPEREEVLDRALSIISSMRIKRELTDDEVNASLNRIMLRYDRKAQKKAAILNIARWASAAAVVLLVVGSALLYNYFASSSIAPNIDLNLNKIQLAIDASNVLAFDNEVEITIDENNNVKVLEKGTNRVSHYVLDQDIENNCIYVPRGKRSVVTMPDNTKVWINSGSSLYFTSSYNNKTRDVRLEGEAYFEVAKNKSLPFRVDCSQFDILVTGTSFNISDYKDVEEKQIVLAEGSLTVNDRQHKKSVKLKPDQKLSIVDSKWSVNTVIATDLTCWKDGVLKFSQCSLDDLSTWLSRYYDINIVCDSNCDTLMCSGKLVLFDEPKDVMISLCEIFPLDYSENVEHDIYIKINKHK